MRGGVGGVVVIVVIWQYLVGVVGERKAVSLWLFHIISKA